MRGWLFLIGLTVAACGSDVTSEPGSGGGGSAGHNTGGGGATSSSGGAGGSGTGGHGNGGVCNPTGDVCNSPTPICSPGEVPEVVGGCWGDCVPILSGETEPNCDNCQSGFCAEYVAFVTEYRCVMPSLMCSALVCSCMAPYFCAAPYDACSDISMGVAVSCSCPSC